MIDNTFIRRFYSHMLFYLWYYVSCNEKHTYIKNQKTHEFAYVLCAKCIRSSDKTDLYMDLFFIAALKCKNFLSFVKLQRYVFLI